MATDRQRVELAIAALERSGWQCGEAVSLDIIEEGDARLRWEPGAWEHVFDGDGQLVGALPMRFTSSSYRGGWCRIQAAFAEGRLGVSVDDATVAVISRDAAPSDLARLIDVIELLRARDWFAEPCWRSEVSYGWEDAREEQRSGRCLGGAVFWTSHAHGAHVDRDGNSRSMLPVQWDGDLPTLERVLARCGVRAAIPHREDCTIAIEPGARAPALDETDWLVELLTDVATAGDVLASWMRCAAPDGDRERALRRSLAACRDHRLLVRLAARLDRARVAARVGADRLDEIEDDERIPIAADLAVQTRPVLESLTFSELKRIGADLPWW